MSSSPPNLSFDTFDDAALQNLPYVSFLYDAQTICKKLSGGTGPAGAFMRRYRSVHESAIISLAQGNNNLRDLRLMLRPYFSHWQHAYLKLLEYLKTNEYSFKDVSTYIEGDAKRRLVFLRYDVHIRDFPGLLGFLDINLALSIPANYYIHWNYSTSESDYSEIFELAKKYAGPLVRFGLHASPVDSWLIWEKFGGNERQQSTWLGSQEGATWLNQLAHDEGKTQEVIEQATEHFIKLAKDFQEHWPNAIGVASHGGALGYQMRRLSNWVDENDPFRKLWYAISARGIMNEAFIENVGMKFETDHMPYTLGYWPVSDSVRDTADYLDQFPPAFTQGCAIELLIHPATLHRGLAHQDLFEKLEERLAQSTVPDSLIDTRSHQALNNSVFIFNSGSDERDARLSLNSERTEVVLRKSPDALNGRWSYRSALVPQSLESGVMYRLEFKFLQLDDTASVKMWVFLYDINGNKIEQLVRGIFKDKGSGFLDLIPNQPVHNIQFHVDVDGSEQLKMSNLCYFSKLNWPYFSVVKEHTSSPSSA